MSEDLWKVYRDAVLAAGFGTAACNDEGLRAIAEKAWDEGHTHCFHVEDPKNAERNPYRKAEADA